MNREILFKAKRKDNNEWVKGYYVRLYNTQNKEVSHRIYTGYSEYCCDGLFEEFYEVIPETICQYTGLTDKNGVKIFENDICKGNSYSLEGNFVIKFGKYKTDDWKNKYNCDTYQFGWYAEFMNSKKQVCLVTPNGIKKIGNIFDCEV